jgi:hypothetical protein
MGDCLTDSRRGSQSLHPDGEDSGMRLMIEETLPRGPPLCLRPPGRQTGSARCKEEPWSKGSSR